MNQVSAVENVFTKIQASTAYCRESARNAGLWFPLLLLRGHIPVLFLSFPAFPPCCESRDRHPSHLQWCQSPGLGLCCNSLGCCKSPVQCALVMHSRLNWGWDGGSPPSFDCQGESGCLGGSQGTGHRYGLTM